MFTRKANDRRRSRSFQPTLDTLADRVAPTVFMPVGGLMLELPPLPDSMSETNTLCGDDIPPLATGH